VSCHSEDDNGGDVREMCGFDYALDLVSEMELAPAFPVVKNYFLVSGKKGKRMPVRLFFSNFSCIIILEI
jgi:hypothetical protein